MISTIIITFILTSAFWITFYHKVSSFFAIEVNELHDRFDAIDAKLRERAEAVEKKL